MVQNSIQVRKSTRPSDESSGFPIGSVIIDPSPRVSHGAKLATPQQGLLNKSSSLLLVFVIGFILSMNFQYNRNWEEESILLYLQSSKRNWQENEEEEAVDCRFLDLLILSDRENTEIPLKGLVNSLLNYTSSPIHLNVVTRAPDIPWLKQLESRYLKVSLHNPHKLLDRSIALVNQTNLVLAHPSSTFAIQKLFLPELPLELSSPENEKFLMIDDDIVVFEDITPLYGLIHEAPTDHISLLCAPDHFNLRKICWKRGVPHNCDDKLYCVTGLVGFPIRNRTARTGLIQSLEQTTHEMMVEYPNSTASQADQDIFNRFFRFHKHSNVQNIPCEWACGTDECGKVLGKMNCRNCNKKNCKAFHYQSKSYLQNFTQLRPEVSWNYYFEKDSKQLRETVFDLEVLESCKKAKERT